MGNHVAPSLQVQVATGGSTGVTDPRDQLTGHYRFPQSDVEGTTLKVGVASGVAVTVGYPNEISRGP